MKLWRRSAKTTFDPPTLLSASLTVSTRVLSMTFNRPVTITQNPPTGDLVTYSGTNKYDTGTIGTNNNYTVTINYPVPSGNVTPANIVYIASPIVIRDQRGNPWPAGTYPVTII